MQNIREIIDLETPPQRKRAPRGKRPRARTSTPRSPANNVVDLMDDSHPGKGVSNKVSKRNTQGNGNEVQILDEWLVQTPVKENTANLPSPAVNTAARSNNKPTRETPLDKIWAVFPDVERKHAEKLLRDFRDDLSMVLSVLADKPYPKQSLEQSVGQEVEDTSSVVVKRARRAPKHDYQSSSSFNPSQVYPKEAISQLHHEFSFFSVQGVKLFFEQNKGRYTIARKSVMDSLKGNKPDAKQLSEETEIAQYHALKLVLGNQRPTEEQLERIGRTFCLKRRRLRPVPSLTDPILIDEVQHANDEQERWLSEMEDLLKRREARRRSQQTGSLMECAVCFEEVAIEEMVACWDGHLFCVDCIRQYAKTAIFDNGNLGTDKETKKPRLELCCCDGGGCQAPLDETLLQRALPFRTLEKYNELQFRASIEQAGLDGEICTCPKCGFQAGLPETQMIFKCPMEDCQFESCKKCGKESHIPLRCDEVVKKKRQDEGRLKVEEAISEAKIRKCPKCATPFVKSDGCNKMTCRCGVKICYICRKQLTGENPYAHFCQTAHCKHKECGKCTLYSNAEEDDERAMREAGVSAAQMYQRELQEADPTTEVEINVNEIMHKPVAGCRYAPRGGMFF